MASEKFMAQLIASSSVSQVGEHITRDMCFLGREHISLGICVSQVDKVLHKKEHVDHDENNF